MDGTNVLRRIAPFIAGACVALCAIAKPAVLLIVLSVASHMAQGGPEYTRFNGPEWSAQPEMWKYEYAGDSVKSGFFKFTNSQDIGPYIHTVCGYSVSPVRILSWKPSASDQYSPEPFFSTNYSLLPANNNSTNDLRVSLYAHSRLSGPRSDLDCDSGYCNYNGGFIDVVGEISEWSAEQWGYPRKLNWGSLRFPIIKYLGPYSYASNSILTTVSIPAGVTHIEDGAFKDCKNLTKVVLPASLEYIGRDVFYGCNQLGDVTLPQCLCTQVVSSVFSTYSSITNVVISDGVTSIGAYAFESCRSLTSVTIPGSVTNIGGCAFYGCRSLTSVTIPGKMTNIGNFAFYNCGLTSVTIPGSVTNIGGGAFWYCKSLTSVTIPDSVRSIGNSAFRDCSGLTNVAIPDSVTSIGMFAFKDLNQSLYDTTTIPGVKLVDGWVVGWTDALSGALDLTGVRGICARVFDGCSGLTDVTIPYNVTSIGDWTFHDCSGLKSVTMGSDAPAVGVNAFYGVAVGCVVRIPRTAKGYDVVDGKWQGMTVEYYDLKAGGATASVGGEEVEFVVSADGRKRTATVAKGMKAEDIKISVGGVDVTAGYRVIVEGTTATVVLKPPFEKSGVDGDEAAIAVPWTDNGDGTVTLAVEVVPGLYYSATGAASLEALKTLEPPAASAPAKTGDTLTVPKVDGSQGFYRVWVGEKPF